ncbi:MAG: glycosyltransferase [Crocosphaera sp.]|nr:glycosyltransferase [Crocosphaera sp.]
MSKLGIVVIGRNEGKRLLSCLKSVIDEIKNFDKTPIVYVDSGSTDGSIKVAKSLGVDVVALDPSYPFTAARARNTGFKHLYQHHPELSYIQFIDGDCEIITGWLAAATEVLETQSKIVAVCGWRCERYPEQSLYNRICDVEWHQGNVGEIANFGGDVMIRTQAFLEVEGYNENVIAAEDDELGVRLRQNQGTLWRIDHNCTWHDANIHSFSQWWQRAKRCGYAYGQVSNLHGSPPECKFVTQVRKTWLWGLIIPSIAILFAWPSRGLSLLLLGKYPLTALLVTRKTRQQGFSDLHSLAWGISCAFSVFPGILGLFQFYRNHWQKKQAKIIEYKNSNEDNFSTTI